MGADAPVFISVDWDFFPAGAPQGAALTGSDPETGEPLKVPEWCYRAPARPSESKPDHERSSAWNLIIRAAGDYGLDVSSVYGLHERYGCPGVQRFFDTLARRYAPSGPLWVSDSHAHAYEQLKQAAPGGARVLSFDAHHDLGYNPTYIADDEYLGRVSCENWLHFALTRGLVRELVVIYPDWQPRPRSESDPTHLLSRECAARVSATTWSDWAHGQRRDADWGARCAAVHLARSGWWSPPWLDRDFCALARRFADGGAALERVLDDALTPRSHAPLGRTPLSPA